MFDSPYARKPKEWTSPTGVKTTLYPIGVLAEQLGRTAQTIVKWEIAGNIPKTPFRSKQGVRMYSEEQIQAVVKNAEKAKLPMGGGHRIANTSFPKNNQKSFQELNELYFGKKDEEKKPLNRLYKKEKK